MPRRTLLALALAIAACGRPAPAAPGGDAPYDLADDADLDAERADFDAMAPDDDRRAATRDRLAAAYGARIEPRLAVAARREARDALLDLLSLWSAAELGRGADDGPARAALRRQRPILIAARRGFARAGDELGAAAALVALAWIEPEDPRHLGELEEIIAYDTVAGADRGGDPLDRPIGLLDDLTIEFAAPAAVDRLVAMLIARRRSAEQRMHEATSAAARARGLRGGVTETVRSIVAVLARAGRLAEAPAALEGVTGLGDDRALRALLTAALGPNADAGAVARLALHVAGGPEAEGDPRAALAIAEDGLRRFGGHAGLHALAGAAAAELDRPLVAIGHLEAAVARDPRGAGSAAGLAELYDQRIAQLTAADRTRAAAALLGRFADLEARARRVGVALDPDLADACASHGRGLLGLGELADGRAALERSLALRPTLAALDALGTLALKQGRPREAVARFERALAIVDDDPHARYQRAKLHRSMADALAADGADARATAIRAAGLAAWDRIDKELDLPAALAADAWLERGKLMWQLGERPTARRAFRQAIGKDATGTSIHADVVAFLVVQGDRAAALDAYLDGLGRREVDDDFKVYMSLWMLAEARRHGEPPPPLAVEFLAARGGPLWIDALARLATGRATRAELVPRATSRGRRAELDYYAAVVGDARDDDARARALLEGVLASDMLLFFEYDMARRWLASPPIAR